MDLKEKLPGEHVPFTNFNTQHRQKCEDPSILDYRTRIESPFWHSTKLLKLKLRFCVITKSNSLSKMTSLMNCFKPVKSTNKVGSIKFNFSSSENDVPSSMDIKGSTDDPAGYFSPLNFDTSNFSGFLEFPRPPFEDAESLLAFLPRLKP